MSKVSALSVPEKQFLQRLLASHVLSHTDAQALWHSILSSSSDPTTSQQQQDLMKTLGVINASLRTGFGLEVCTISLPSRVSSNDDTSKSNAEKRNKNAARESGTTSSSYEMHHAIVNRTGDDISKTWAAAGGKIFGPHELALFRIILERLVEQRSTSPQPQQEEELEDSDNEEDDHPAGTFLSRIDLINLRMELTGPHANKLSAHQAEKVVTALEEECWLTPAPPTLSDSSPTKKKRRSSSPTRKRRSRSKDDEQGLQIGIRTYMELTEMLVNELGMDRDALPQFILHSIS